MEAGWTGRCLSGKRAEWTGPRSVAMWHMLVMWLKVGAVQQGRVCREAGWAGQGRNGQGGQGFGCAVWMRWVGWRQWA